MGILHHQCDAVKIFMSGPAELYVSSVNACLAINATHNNEMTEYARLLRPPQWRQLWAPLCSEWWQIIIQGSYAARPSAAAAP